MILTLLRVIMMKVITNQIMIKKMKIKIHMTVSLNQARMPRNPGTIDQNTEIIKVKK